MKKDYLMGLIACAALTMTGCSNDEIGNPQQGQGDAIEFGTYLGRDAQGSRGTVTNDDAIKSTNKGFGVLAYYTAGSKFSNSATPNFMYNQQVTYSNNSWSYNPVKYWPTKVGEMISFFAYAPYNGDGIKLSENNVTGAPTATITLQEPANMIDFVAGVQMDKTHDASNSTVAFTLLHEMTRVGIKAKLDDEVYANTTNTNKVKTFVVIKEVRLSDVTNGKFYKSGKYTFSTATGTRGTWSDLTSGASFDLEGILNKTIITANDAKAATTSGDYKTGVKGIKLTNATAQDLFNTNAYLFLIPATANDGDGLTKSGATATISYDIVTEDSNLAAGYSCTSATKTVYLPEKTMKQGVAYTYTFTIKLDEVKLSASVADWGNETSGTDVNVPYTPDDATKANQGN